MTTQHSQEILPVVGKKHSPKILQATAEPRSAQELSEEFDIPIATCYRRIDELVDQGLLELHDTRVNGEGASEKVYRRAVTDIYVDFSGTLSVSTESASSTHKIDSLWRKIRRFPRQVM